jgi:hypothetical protein
MIDKALVYELSQVSGSIFSGKVYPLVSPENTPAPYIVYSTNEGIHYRSLDGLLVWRRVVCTLYVTCNDYQTLHSSAREIQSKFESITGQTMGGASYPIVVEEVEISEDPDEFYNEEAKKYQAEINFILYL